MASFRKKEYPDNIIYGSMDIKCKLESGFLLLSQYFTRSCYNKYAYCTYRDIYSLLLVRTEINKWVVTPIFFMVNNSYITEWIHFFKELKYGNALN